MQNTNTGLPAKTISVLGCGWFGLALAKELVAKGYKVNGSTTTPEKLNLLKAENITPFLINFSANQQHADEVFFNSDVLFICIPPKRNSSELTDYPEKINSILHRAKPNQQVVLISSTSVYGDCNEVVNEHSETQPDTASGKIILTAEQNLHRLRPENATIIRFAGLIGPDRNPGRFFAGKTNIANGLAPVNLIHQIDAVGFACALLEKSAFGHTFNACNPNHPSKMDFYTAAAKESNLPLPAFIAEKISWKIVVSLNVNLLGYMFQKQL